MYPPPHHVVVMRHRGRGVPGLWRDAAFRELLAGAAGDPATRGKFGASGGDSRRRAVVRARRRHRTAKIDCTHPCAHRHDRPARLPHAVRCAVRPCLCCATPHDPAPSTLRRPGPEGAMVQCYIQRRKSGMARLFPTYEIYLKDGDQFLLAARKRKKNKSSNYLISLDKDDLTRQSDNFFGKLRSNFLGTEFSLYDKGANPEKLEQSQRDSSGVEVRQELGTILFKQNVLGSRGPRKMKVMVPNVNEAGQRKILRPQSSEETMLERYKAAKNDDDVQILKNKPPKWNEQVGAYVLNFNGRVTRASVKNFQLYNPSKDRACSPLPLVLAPRCSPVHSLPRSRCGHHAVRARGERRLHDGLPAPTVRPASVWHRAEQFRLQDRLRMVTHRPSRRRPAIVSAPFHDPPVFAAEEKTATRLRNVPRVSRRRGPAQPRVHASMSMLSGEITSQIARARPWRADALLPSVSPIAGDSRAGASRLGSAMIGHGRS